MQNKLNFNLRECQSLFFFSLEKLIYETLRQYEGIIKGSEQNFELYGFDILPSSNFNLHLL